MKIVLRQIDAASVFRNERMGMPQLSPRLVELHSRAAGQPNRGDSFVVQRRREFIKSSDNFPALRKQGINRNVENARSLSQTNLQNRNSNSNEIGAPLAEQQQILAKSASSAAEKGGLWEQQGKSRNASKKGGQKFSARLSHTRLNQPGFSLG